MDWLTQNWAWIALAIGGVWLFSRGGLAGCGMGGHGGHGRHRGGAGPVQGGAPSGNDPMRYQGAFGAATPEKTVDPISGQEVLATRALTTIYQGRVFYFASAANRERFEAAPEKYARDAAPAARPHRHHGGC